MAQTAVEARLAKVKAQQGKEKKGKFGKRRGEDQSVAQPELPNAEAPSVVAETPATPAPTEPAKAESADTPKKPKKVSSQVVAWRAQKAFPLTAKITEVMKDNPKRKSAAARFALYDDGMTVGEYIEKSKKAGNTGALAAADVRWDHTAGFIKVVE